MKCILRSWEIHSRIPMNPPITIAIAGRVRRSTAPAAMPSAVANTE